jgi:anti-sigma B factor antagonist
LPAERPGSVAVENGGGPIRVRLAGAIDAVIAPQLEATVAAVVARQPADVRMDLADVDFLGSHGMAFLVRLRHAAQSGGRRAGIDVASHPAQVALRVAGLEDLFRD